MGCISDTTRFAPIGRADEGAIASVEIVFSVGQQTPKVACTCSVCSPVPIRKKDKSLKVIVVEAGERIRSLLGSPAMNIDVVGTPAGGRISVPYMYVCICWLWRRSRKVLSKSTTYPTGGANCLMSRNEQVGERTHTTRFWDFDDSKLFAIDFLHLRAQFLLANHEDDVDWGINVKKQMSDDPGGGSVTHHETHQHKL